MHRVEEDPAARQGFPGVAPAREGLRQALGRAVRRIERRAEAVRGDLARAAEADQVAGRARIFVAEAARAPRGATRLVAVDWSSGEPREVEMKLDPARGAREQIDAVFHRARRLKEGARIARDRLADAEKALAALREVERELEASEEAGLEELEARAKKAAPRDFRSPGGQAPPRKRGGGTFHVAYRVFVGESGAKILVGKGASDNDELTLHVARPRDLWLHAKNRTGAHVVVPLARGQVCPPELLAEAAHLAAHFSDARGEDLVEVQHTSRRYLRKPRGSPPGFVVVDREKVILLRLEPERLRRLLERESEP